MVVPPDKVGYHTLIHGTTTLIIKMKTINETFEDRDYKKLVKRKGSLTWKKFILSLLEEPTEKELIKEFEIIKEKKE